MIIGNKIYMGHQSKSSGRYGTVLFWDKNVGALKWGLKQAQFTE